MPSLTPASEQASAEAHNQRLMRELITTELSGRPEVGAEREPFIYNLVGQEGNFESSKVNFEQRSFGLWSYRQPEAGDLVIRPSPQGKTLWRIESVAMTFKGSDDNMFWKGVMTDIIGTNSVTERDVKALTSKGYV